MRMRGCLCALMVVLKNYAFSFIDNIIPLTDNYTHLGFTFIADTKWIKHFENLSHSKYLCMLRKIRFTLYRQNVKILSDQIVYI